MGTFAATANIDYRFSLVLFSGYIHIYILKQQHLYRYRYTYVYIYIYISTLKRQQTKYVDIYRDVHTEITIFIYISISTYIVGYRFKRKTENGNLGVFA